MQLLLQLTPFQALAVPAMTPMGGFTAAAQPSSLQILKITSIPNPRRKLIQFCQGPKTAIFLGYLCSNFASTPCPLGQCLYVPLIFTQENKHSEIFIGYLITLLL